MPTQYVKPYVKTNKSDYIDGKPSPMRCNGRGCACADQDRGTELYGQLGRGPLHAVHKPLVSASQKGCARTLPGPHAQQFHILLLWNWRFSPKLAIPRQSIKGSESGRFWSASILLFRFQNMRQKTLYLSSSFFVWGLGTSFWICTFPSKDAPSSMVMRGV